MRLQIYQSTGNAPCYDCEERFLGCHSSCLMYKEFKAKDMAIKETRFQNRSPRSSVSLKYMSNHFYKAKPSKYNT